MRAKTIRRAVVAVAAAGAMAAAASGAAHAYLPDPIRLTDSEIDFGDSNWLISAPVGPGSVQWSVVSGFYTPRLVGTLHLDNANGEWGRMHIDYYDGGGNHLYTAHSVAHEAPDNGHNEWPVNLSPPDPLQIVQVRVCTEMSDDGDHFSQIDCTGRLYMN